MFIPPSKFSKFFLIIQDQVSRAKIYFAIPAQLLEMKIDEVPHKPGLEEADCDQRVQSDEAGVEVPGSNVLGTAAPRAAWPNQTRK